MGCIQCVVHFEVVKVVGREGGEDRKVRGKEGGEDGRR
jgi:ribosomal protein S26